MDDNPIKDISYYIETGDIVNAINELGRDDYRMKVYISYLLWFHESWEGKGKRNNYEYGHSLWDNIVIARPEKSINELLVDPKLQDIKKYFIDRGVLQVRDITEDHLKNIMYFTSIKFMEFRELVYLLFGKTSKHGKIRFTENEQKDTHEPDSVTEEKVEKETEEISDEIAEEVEEKIEQDIEEKNASQEESITVTDMPVNEELNEEKEMEDEEGELQEFDEIVNLYENYIVKQQKSLKEKDAEIIVLRNQLNDQIREKISAQMKKDDEEEANEEKIRELREELQEIKKILDRDLE